MQRLLLSAALGTLLAAAPPATNLGNGHTLTPRTTFTDPQGQTHTRCQHSYQGLRVWGSGAILHRGADGAALPATLPREPLTSALPAPSWSQAEAQDAVRRHLGPLGAAATLSARETVLWPQRWTPAATGGPLNASAAAPILLGYRPAHLIRARAGPGQGWDHLVDAGTGAIRQRIPLDHLERPARGPGDTLYSGLVLLDDTGTEPGFLLLDRTRTRSGRLQGNGILDGGHSSGGFAGVCKLPAGQFNLWGDGRPEFILDPGPGPFTVAADAAFGLQSVWDYFLKVHQRNGWDGQGTGTFVLTHVIDPDGKLADNAFWSTEDNGITITDAVRFWPQSSLFAVAHEFGHGVSSSAAELVYEGETAGLCEATSDIFAAMTTAFVRNRLNGRIGDGGAQWGLDRISWGPDRQLLTEGMRSMVHPSLDGVSPDAWRRNLARLDPHHAAGPMNRAFYFLSQGASASPGRDDHSELLPGGMTGIGNDKAAAIWYRALTTYLPADAGYVDAREAALRAAIDLHGSGSAENIAVHKAFGAINVGDPEDLLDDFEPPQVTAQANLANGILTVEADASDNDRVQVVRFFVDSRLVGEWLEPPYRLALDTRRLLANGEHRLIVAAWDPSGNTTVSEPFPFTLANATQQLLEDPGLDPDSSAWSGLDGVADSQDLMPVPNFGATRYALFGAGGQFLAQRVTLPADAAQATLELHAWISADPRGPVQGPLRVLVRSAPDDPAAAPRLLAVLGAFSSRDAWEDWLAYRFDLSAFRGQTVELRLELDEPAPACQFRFAGISLLAGAAPVAVRTDPERLDLQPGASSEALAATVTGSDNHAVIWRQLDGGALDGASLRFTAPDQPGFYHVQATAEADPFAADQVSIRVRPAFELNPTQVAVDPGGRLVFTLTRYHGSGTLAVSMLEGAAAGTVEWTPDSEEVRYRAPAAAGVYHLMVVDADAPAIRAEAVITVHEPLQITTGPGDAVLAVGSSGRFWALSNRPGPPRVAWSILEGAGGGRLGPDPEAPDLSGIRYTAPSRPGVYHLVASDPADPGNRALLAVQVVDAMAISPAQATLIPGQTRLFQVTFPGAAATPFRWRVQGGSIGDDGLYTAPARAGICLVWAEALDGSGRVVSARVKVQSLDPEGDGAGLGLGGLALLADAYGTVALPGQAGSADLNGDGVVDDLDLVIALAAFEKAGAEPLPPAP